MNYPFWYIPKLGSGWVIGIIAIFHVMISQFAVGGGFYLPMAERKARRIADPNVRLGWLNQLSLLQNSANRMIYIEAGTTNFRIGLSRPTPEEGVPTLCSLAFPAS